MTQHACRQVDPDRSPAQFTDPGRRRPRSHSRPPDRHRCRYRAARSDNGRYQADRRNRLGLAAPAVQQGRPTRTSRRSRHTALRIGIPTSTANGTEKASASSGIGRPQSAEGRRYPCHEATLRLRRIWRREEGSVEQPDLVVVVTVHPTRPALSCRFPSRGVARRSPPTTWALRSRPATPHGDMPPSPNRRPGTSLASPGCPRG